VKIREFLVRASAPLDQLLFVVLPDAAPAAQSVRHVEVEGDGEYAATAAWTASNSWREFGHPPVSLAVRDSEGSASSGESHWCEFRPVLRLLECVQSRRPEFATTQRLAGRMHRRGAALDQANAADRLQLRKLQRGHLRWDTQATGNANPRLISARLVLDGMVSACVSRQR